MRWVCFRFNERQSLIERDALLVLLAQALSNTKIRVAKYHAGMDVLDREAAHRAFMTGQVSCVSRPFTNSFERVRKL